MRYIKLYEAFKSEKISKTLKWINPSSIEDFKKSLLGVAKKIDVHLSEFSDDMFKYLPLEDAINYGISDNMEVGKEICYKFWFDIEGNFNGVTFIDGTKIAQLTSLNFSRDINDYVKLGQMSFNDVISSPSMTPVFIESPTGRNGVGVLIKELEYENSTRELTFFLQDEYRGSIPHRWNYYSKYVSGSWVISSPYDISSLGIIIKLSPKSEDGNYNIPIDSEDPIYKSHFALIVDLGDIKGTGLGKVLSDRESRREFKKTDDEIKFDNYRRYIKKIVDGYININIKDEFDNILTRGLGYNKFLFFLTNIGQISTIKNMIANGQDSLSHIENFYDVLLKRIDLVNRRISQIKDMNPEEGNYINEFTEECLKISQIIYTKIIGTKIESETDFTYRLNFILYIDNIYRNAGLLMIIEDIIQGRKNQVDESEYQKLISVNNTVQKYI
jgi:hypothetical protein